MYFHRSNLQPSLFFKSPYFIYRTESAINAPASTRFVNPLFAITTLLMPQHWRPHRSMPALFVITKIKLSKTNMGI
jgi:hypothetical protein